jgi:hypothetical protein
VVHHQDVITCSVTSPKQKGKLTTVSARLTRAGHTYAKATAVNALLHFQAHRRLAAGTYTVIIESAGSAQRFEFTIPVVPPR